MAIDWLLGEAHSVVDDDHGKFAVFRTAGQDE
jgi:hypothetical protein